MGQQYVVHPRIRLLAGKLHWSTLTYRLPVWIYKTRMEALLSDLHPCSPYLESSIVVRLL